MSQFILKITTKIGFKLVSAIYIIFLAAYALSFLGYYLEIINPSKFYSTITKNQYYFLDFARYYTFAKMIGLNLGHKLYFPDVQKSVFSSVIYPAKCFDYYVEYPPYNGIIFYPLILFNFNLSYVLFSLLSLIFYFAVITYLKNKLSVNNEFNILYFNLGVFACLPTMYNILLGQINFLIAGSIYLFFAALLFNKPFRYAFVNLFIFCKPHYLFFFSLIPLIKLKFKFLAVSLAVFILLVFISYLCTGFENTFNYPKILYDIHAKGQYQGIVIDSEIVASHVKYIISLRSLFNIFMSKQYAVILSFITFIIGTFASYVVIRKTRFEPGQNFAWSVSLVTLIFVVTCPHFFAQDLIILALPALITMKSLDLGKILEYDIYYKTWSLIFYFYPIWSWANYLLINGNSDWRQYINLGVNLILLFIAFKKFQETSVVAMAG